MTEIANQESLDDEIGPPRRRRAGPAALLVTLMGLGLASFLLYDLRSEIAWWFGAPETVDLGSPGGYRTELASDGALAKIAGRPGGSAARFSRLGVRYEIVAIEGTNVLIQRRLPDSAPRIAAGQPEPAPDRNPFVAEGRLVRDSSAPLDYAQAFRLLVERGDAQPRDGHLFVLFDGERPRTGLKLPAILAALLGLVALNLWTLARAFVSRRGPAQGPKA